ncbi:oligosaccharide flippase family protein [Acidicapsa dinghuensis]|uniref:Oligosaccharide flippase family protein n=1 Tax=Acidicapsa dinghuensis TaxID=2218256 RepID=A0ABW1ECT9_9BACT|nr:oligosaccharide flippase family protein [Acidicapsa dinghuensis]
MSALAEPDEARAIEASAEAEERARKGLESTAVRATFWTVMDYGISMALRVVNSLVLTHLLAPEFFGLMTLVSTLVVGISLISDIGLGPSVIQNANGDDPVLLNTAWTLQILRGVGIFAVVLVLSWPMSLFYHEPQLIGLMLALGLNIVLGAFNSTNILSMSRHMGVRRQFALDISTQIFNLLVTAGCAVAMRSVWALVIGTLASTCYKLILSHNHRVLPGIRNKFCWDPPSVRSLVQFGKWILLATALFFFASQADRLIMGRLISFALLGVYGVAYQVSDIPRAVINAFSNRVVFPFISKMTHLPIEEFRQVFLGYRLRALLAGSVLLALMAHLGGFVVTKVYDHRYHEASWMVPVLALGLWHTLLYSTTFPALLALGKSRYGAIGNGAYLAAVATAIPLGFHFYGMFGAVVAVAAGDFPLYVVGVSGANREGVSTWRQDIQLTVLFAVLLGIGQAIRYAILH